MMTDTPDPFGRPPIPEDMKNSITAALNAIPQGNTYAAVLLVTEEGTRLHAAAKFGEHWKVGGGISYSHETHNVVGFVGVMVSG
jgi:hypothetical protein